MKPLNSVNLVQVEGPGSECGCGCGCSDTTGVTATTHVEAIQERYSQVAERAARNEVIDTSCCGNASSLYPADDLKTVTPQAAGASAGCGNPVGIAEVRTGEKVLDLGSGGGIDCFLAAQATGPEGHVYGVDMTPEMLQLARENAAKLDAQNVTFLLGRIEAVPLPDAAVDLVISNCVIALAPDKQIVFEEIFRVLKPGGRFVVSDIVSTMELPEQAKQDMAEWVSCIGGAELFSRYLERISAAGFERTEVLVEKPYTSERTDDAWRGSLRSATMRAFKPVE